MPPSNSLEVTGEGYRIGIVIGVQAEPGRESHALRRAGEITERIGEVL